MTKYTKKVSIGAFLKKGEDFKANDIVEIANEGRQIEGQYGLQDIFLIRLADGKEGNVNFNQTSLNNIIDNYGDDSVNWIGKCVKVWAILSNVQGKMKQVYYFLHPETILDEVSGEFISPKKKKELPEINVDEEVSAEDLPF